MEQLLMRFGLLAVFAGTALEGDGSMIVAGVLAHLGFFGLPTAMAVGCLGAVVIDLACYAIGRHRAAAIRRTRLYRGTGAAVERLVQRLGPWEVPLSRFVYGTRVGSMFFWGMQRLPFGRFVGLDVLGCAAWAVALGGLGFASSASATVLLGRVERVERWLLLAVVLTAATVVAVRALVRRQLRRSVENERADRKET
jgi:membrane protein DedA with SNARE-associated domain